MLDDFGKRMGGINLNTTSHITTINDIIILFLGMGAGVALIWKVFVYVYKVLSKIEGELNGVDGITQTKTTFRKEFEEFKKEYKVDQEKIREKLGIEED